MRGFRSLVVAVVALAGTAAGQIAFHGEVNPLIRLTMDQRYLSLPHRFVVLNGEQRGDRVSLYFSTALEYRLDTNVATPDLREAYAEFSTGLGDFRFGKQILAWGAVDGNNPTDNVNPYDFYYLFLSGIDRKIGTFSASANLYLGNLNLEVVLTPVFQPHRLPINEPDFPIFAGEPSPLSSLVIEEVERSFENSEFGLRARLPLAMFDLSWSYFRGFDRMLGVASVLKQSLDTSIPVSLGYQQTQVFGADLVTFIGNWAVRAEGAYFLTPDRDADDPFIRNPYFQYVVQGDYTGTAGSWMVQYLGTYITGLDGDNTVDPATGTVVTEFENERDNLPAKIGMPFAVIAPNALLAAASLELADAGYTFRVQALVDLDNGGLMVGGGLAVHLADAFDLELGLTLLGGDEGSRLNGLKDFSHLSVAFKYSF